MLADPCADPRIFARVVQARLPENSSDNGFCLFFVLNFYSFTVAYQWFISKKTIILQGFGGGGGGPIYSGGGGSGSGGPNTYSRNPWNFLFSRRGCGPSIPHLDPHM